MISVWITITILIVAIIINLFIALFSLYKIDMVRRDVDKYTTYFDSKMKRFVDAINSVNKSEFDLDMIQQKQIDTLRNPQ